MWIILLKYKKQIAIGIAVLVLTVVIYAYFKGYFKPSTVDVIVPDDTVGAVLSNTDNIQVHNLALALHDTMNSMFGVFRDNSSIINYSTVSDKVMAAVYNEFNSLYPGTGSLRSWLSSEWFYIGSDASSVIANVIFPRMDKLGLV